MYVKIKVIGASLNFLYTNIIIKKKKKKKEEKREKERKTHFTIVYLSARITLEAQ